MTVPATPFNASQFLKQKVLDVKSWYDSGPHRVDGFHVRNMPASVEFNDFLPAQKSEKNRVRFNLIVNKNYKLWSINMEVQFFCQSWLTHEGVASPPGLMCAVLDEKGGAHSFEFFPMTPVPGLDNLTPEQWCCFWIQKMLKKSSIRVIFAHRQLLASEFDDV